MSVQQSTFLAIDEKAPLLLSHEEKSFIAAYKPAGQLFHGHTKGLPETLVDQLKGMLKEREQKPGSVYLGVVHRLDRAVSGLALFGRNSKITGRLSEQIQNRSMEKTYLAIVEGQPREASASLVDMLPKLGEEGTAQECSLQYKLLAHAQGLSLLAIKLETGRRHQIRRQLALRSWPIVGDKEYGASTVFPATEALDPRFRPIALHAAALRLLHPLSYQPLLLRAEVPVFWQLISSQLSQHCHDFLAEL